MDMILHILDFADIDTRIKMKHIRKLNTDNSPLSSIYRPPRIWNNDFFEWMAFFPLPSKEKQYVLSINMQNILHHTIIEFWIVSFVSSTDHLLFTG